MASTLSSSFTSRRKSGSRKGYEIHIQDDSTRRTRDYDETSPTSVERFPEIKSATNSPIQFQARVPVSFDRWSPWSPTEAAADEESPRPNGRQDVSSMVEDYARRQPPPAPRLDGTSCSSEEDPIDLIETSSALKSPTFNPSLSAAIQQNEESTPSLKTRPARFVPPAHITCDPVFTSSSSDEWGEEDETIINSFVAPEGNSVALEELSTTESHSQRHALMTKDCVSDSEALLGLVVGVDDYEDDESTVYEEETVETQEFLYHGLGVGRTSSLLSYRTSSFLTVRTTSFRTATTDMVEEGEKRVRFSRGRALESIRYITDDEDSCSSVEEEAQESQNHIASYMAKTQFIMGQLPQEQKEKCEESLSNLSRAFCKSRDRSLNAKSITELQSLYRVDVSRPETKRGKKKKEKPSKRKSLTKKTKEKGGKSRASEGRESTRSSIKAKKEEETLRGLEVHLTDVHGLLQRRHRAAVLRVQERQKRRQQRKLNEGSTSSPDAEFDVEARLRKASRKASRPLRYLAIQMAKHDTLEALRSVLTKWKQ